MTQLLTTYWHAVGAKVVKGIEGIELYTANAEVSEAMSIE